MSRDQIKKRIKEITATIPPVEVTVENIKKMMITYVGNMQSLKFEADGEKIEYAQYFKIEIDGNGSLAAFRVPSLKNAMGRLHFESCTRDDDLIPDDRPLIGRQPDLLFDPRIEFNEDGDTVVRDHTTEFAL